MSIGDYAKKSSRRLIFIEIRENVLPVYPDFPRSLQQGLFDIASKFASLPFLRKKVLDGDMPWLEVNWYRGFIAHRL
jgi:hypothetical protein